MKAVTLLFFVVLMLLTFVAYSATTEQVTQALEEFVATEGTESAEPEIMSANQQSMVETLAVTESDEPIVEDSGFDLEETL
jgi:uncharacterized BrkB/YihY/UPF0761 family membrane protein